MALSEKFWFQDNYSKYVNLVLMGHVEDMGKVLNVQAIMELGTVALFILKRLYICCFGGGCLLNQSLLKHAEDYH